MCLIMTFAAALALTALAMSRKQEGCLSRSLETTALMFWAAALMWSVDGIASVREGESFFDLSAGDTLLGLIVLAGGGLAYAALAAFEKWKEKRKRPAGIA